MGINPSKIDFKIDRMPQFQNRCLQQQSSAHKLEMNSKSSILTIWLSIPIEPSSKIVWLKSVSIELRQIDSIPVLQHFDFPSPIFEIDILVVNQIQFQSKSKLLLDSSRTEIWLSTDEYQFLKSLLIWKTNINPFDLNSNRILILNH